MPGLRRNTSMGLAARGAALVLLAGAWHALASDPSAADLDGQFHRAIVPFVQAQCVSCHNAEKAKGDFDLTPYASLGDVAKDYRRWELLAQRLEAHEMPPEKAKQQPTPEQSRAVVAWIHAVRRYEAHLNAGDPGPVFARRLTNAEYDNSVRDLTGVDLRPAKEFPVDPANEAGFENSSETLAMTPGLVKKYLEAARGVADHLVLKPDGIEFAPHPVVADTDRDKYCVNQIIGFYQRQHTDFADYFEAAWRFRNRASLGHARATLDSLAGEAKLSPKYLATVSSLLNGPAEEVGPIAALQAMWRELPTDPVAARAGCAKMRDFVVNLRAKLVPTVPNLTSPKLGDGSQPLVLWKDRELAANRTRYAAGSAVKIKAPALAEGSPAARAMVPPTDAATLARSEASFTRFCATFPDAFFISERARVFVDPKSEKDLTGRLLSAGFHNQMGYFRDDRPLYDLMLSDADRHELDRLWQEFDFVAAVPSRQYANFLWFERAEIDFVTGPDFNFVRAEDKDLLSPAKLQRFSQAYLAKVTRLGGGPVAVQAMKDFFREFYDREQTVEKLATAAEPVQIRALLAFAERAYRRPMPQAERDGLMRFYHALRSQDGEGHEDAMRDSIVSVLMSPSFCYRLDLPRKGEGSAVRPLGDVALANRLSYFLWASMPDRTLMDLAAAGELHRPEVISAQARRMLADERARGFAVEFTGNWLDFRRFEEHNSVDRTRFASFDNDLREAMFEEPIRFFLDIARRGGSVLDFLYGDYTFVNDALAHHYGMPAPSGGPNAWVKVDGASQFGRGGLLPMAVFLTKNSPGLRTSPVKRGNWVVKRILGEHIPPPPTKVPDLPSDEAKADLPLRDALARHRADPSCAACHERFDSMGLIFEGYGPIGEVRKTDLGGRPIDNSAAFPGGLSGSGLGGLRDYIRQKRQDDFVDNLCRELLAYGLGRTLLISDDETVESMRQALVGNGYRFDKLIEGIVTSPQFLTQRAGVEPAKE